MNGYVETKQGQIHYRMAGKGGPWVILVHQTPLSSRQFAASLPYLGQDCRAVAFDCPGYGSSYVPTRPPSIADYATVLNEAAGSLTRDSYTVVGVVSGALIALEMARQTPKKVHRLVLVGTPFIPREKLLAMGRAHLASPELSRDGAHMIAAWNGRRNSWGDDCDVRLLHEATADVVQVYERHHWALVASTDCDVAALLDEVDRPALFLSAEKDKLAGFNKTAAERAKQGTYEVMAGTAEPFFMSSPEIYAKRVSACARGA